ncbi:Disease resistance protein L6 [Linum perenne]
MAHLLGSEASSFTSCSSTPFGLMPPLPNAEYEVFLSFRGPDVRTTFADCLYSGLVRSKIRTFRDEEELRKGETIGPSLVQAITESKIYIPIFTKGYAASKWCLMELAKMVACWKQGKGHMVLPIFYYVDPRDVRHQDGPYKESFEQHSQNHDPEIVKKWREALQEIGKMKGWHLTESQGQGEVIDEILSKVELHLRSNYTLVNEELVGIDSHVQDVTKLMNLDSDGERVVGIHGMGGIGKTTIAKAVYDVVCTSFDKCCFLDNVRNVLSKDDGATTLQNKVISTILGYDNLIKNVGEGIRIIRDRVCKYKVLIVLDDVDEKFEFDQVLGRLGNFSLESRFIITTRDKRVLEFFRDQFNLYEVKEMNYDYSLQLFSKHAFQIDYPSKEFKMLSQEIIKMAAGLPLALKVLGSLLYNRDTKFWEEKLVELRKIPCTSDKVQETLKISYNELSRNEKRMFLDISCCFVGEDKDWPFYMWEDCDLYPESGIKTLLLRALIKIDEKNKFWMHDHIRDLGRAIVVGEDVENPCNRSIIWSNVDAVDLLKNGKGTDVVEMMRVDLGYEHKLTNKELNKLKGLRYLDVKCGSLSGDFCDVLANLRWIRLRSHCQIPTNLNIKNCVILDLVDSQVKSEWRGWKGIKYAGKLKVLKLRECGYIDKFPDVSSCVGLEVIHVTYSLRMTGVLDISSFTNLKSLVLDNTGITELRGDIGLLHNLQEIVIKDCELRETPAAIFKLSSLQILNLTSHRKKPLIVTEDIPTAVKHLSISCLSVPNLLNLHQLEELHYLCCRETEIPADLWKLPKLKTLTLKFCSSSHHTHSPALPSSLVRLDISYCQYLQTLPSLANLTSLAEIPGLGELKMLSTLQLCDVQNMENLDGIENLVQLTVLVVELCGVVGKFPDVSNLTKLKSLSIICCQRLTEIQDLSGLKDSLTFLEIKASDCLTKVEGIETLESLQVLSLERTGGSASLLPSSLSKFCKLQELTYKESWYVPDEMSPQQLPDLPVDIKVLKIKCESIKKLPDLSKLAHLEKLNVQGCTYLTEIRGLERLVSLQKLVVSDCYFIKELNLCGAKNLRKLKAFECVRLKRVHGIEELELLQVLEVDTTLRNTVLKLKSAASRLRKRLTRSLGL